MNAVIVMAVLLPVLMAAAFLLGRHLHRRQFQSEELSAVTRQHIDLFQGGQLSEAAVELTKARFRDLLEKGEIEAIEKSLNPGMHFVVQVRALTELGTDDAVQILERQLGRRLTDDSLEQSWYMIDLANGLRSLNRSHSLPHLLRCADAAGEIPLGQFFAAEMICFLGFSSYLRHPETPLGRSALRVLHHALEGLRCGVQPIVVAEARIGEMIEILWDNKVTTIDPLVMRVFKEALRLLRRAPSAEELIGSESSDQEAFSWQISRLASLEPGLTEYLQESPEQLRRQLLEVEGQAQRDVLQALIDLRAEAGREVLPLLTGLNSRHTDLALELLSWSRDDRVGPSLIKMVMDRLPMSRRQHIRPRAMPPYRASVPGDLPFRGILRALRGHPSPQTENFLLMAARDWDPTVRAVAVSSLGWWEPLERTQVLQVLQEARRDSSPEVRQAARAALARLGERQSLQWFRQTLLSEDPQRVHEAIQIVSTEGLTLLWPDLDRLADSDDPDVAHHAQEAMERMSEELDHPSR